MSSPIVYDTAHKALYDFIESLIENAGADTPLFEAKSFRTLRGNVDEAKKIVRVYADGGFHQVSKDPESKQKGVDFLIQCIVTPDDDSEWELEVAIDVSFGMSQQIFQSLMSGAGMTLSSKVCTLDGNEYWKDVANMGGQDRGASYHKGVINRDI